MYAPAALVALMLSGCGAGPQASTATEVAVTSPSTAATATPTPTVMSVADAGKFYLTTVCPTNALGDKASAIMQTKPLDLGAAKSATAALRDGHRKVVETLSDPKVLWPDVVKADIVTLTDAIYGEVSGADNVAKQTTESGLINAWNGWTSPPALASTAQKIRLKLGLAADTSSSCSPN